MAVEDLLRSVIKLTRQAGAAVMDIYQSDDFDVQLKSDQSPLTRADLAANEIIVAGLQQLADYPVVSEEGNHETTAKTFWLVDPIDGTKEFIKKNGEFTINIGLVEDGVPVLGVVLLPAQDVLYYGSPAGAFKQIGDQSPVKISAAYADDVPTVAVSRSHLNDQTQQFVDKLGTHKLVQSGSSIKLCLVAEGTASVYPRFAPTSLWDTAAADAVVRAAGGSVTKLDGQPLVYDPAKAILNPFFIVKASNYHGPEAAEHVTIK